MEYNPHNTTREHKADQMEQIPLRSEWAKTHQSSGEMKKNQTHKSVDGEENDERKVAF